MYIEERICKTHFNTACTAMRLPFTCCISAAPAASPFQPHAPPGWWMFWLRNVPIYCLLMEWSVCGHCWLRRVLTVTKQRSSERDEAIGALVYIFLYAIGAVIFPAALLTDGRVEKWASCSSRPVKPPRDANRLMGQ